MAARQASVRIELEKLPGGLTVLPMERDGELVWLVDPDHMTEQLCADINEALGHIVGDGLWQQRWDDGAQPGIP
jgi:hypothetical protein